MGKNELAMAVSLTFLLILAFGLGSDNPVDAEELPSAKVRDASEKPLAIPPPSNLLPLRGLETFDVWSSAATVSEENVIVVHQRERLALLGKFGISDSVHIVPYPPARDSTPVSERLESGQLQWLGSDWVPVTFLAEGSYVLTLDPAFATDESAAGPIGSVVGIRSFETD